MGAFDIGQIGQGAAMQAASGIVGTGLGLLLEGHNDRRQLRQQGKLNDLSVKSQKELLEAQRQKEYQMWQDTNYSAQIEQMKKAGVNPALLYGQSGGGGTTTGGSGQGINNTGAPTGGREWVFCSVSVAFSTKASPFFMPSYVTCADCSPRWMLS